MPTMQLSMPNAVGAKDQVPITLDYGCGKKTCLTESNALVFLDDLYAALDRAKELGPDTTITLQSALTGDTKMSQYRARAFVTDIEAALFKIARDRNGKESKDLKSRKNVKSRM